MNGLVIRRSIWQCNREERAVAAETLDAAARGLAADAVGEVGEALLRCSVKMICEFKTIGMAGRSVCRGYVRFEISTSGMILLFICSEVYGRNSKIQEPSSFAERLNTL